MKKNLARWVNFLHFFDVFAVPFSPSLSLKSKQTHHSSSIGGLISLVVYFLSCYYGVSIMVQWINNKMVLKVQQQQNYYQNQIYQDQFTKRQNITHFEFEVLSNDEFGPDPFKNEEVFLIPLLIDPDQQIIQNLLQFHDETSKTIVVNWNNSLLNSSIYVIFVQCLGNERYLKNNQTCGSQERANQFLNQEGLELFIVFDLERIDFTNEVVNKNQSYTKSFIQQNFSSEKFITLQFSYFEISNAILFENSHKYLLTTSFTVRDQMSTRQFLTGNYHYFLKKVKDVYAAFVIGSNSVVNHTIVQSPNLSEVLAQIGSILQTLLLIRYVIQYVNSRLMYTKFKDFFLEVFFPEINQISQLQSKYFLNSKEIDNKSYQQFRKRIDALIEVKLNYANLIYEIAKMQAVLEEISTHFKIYHSHQKICQIQLELIQKPGIYRIVNTWNPKDNNINGTFQQNLYPFAFNYSLSKQCQNFCQSLDADFLDTNSSKNQAKSQLIMKLETHKILDLK